MRTLLAGALLCGALTAQPAVVGRGCTTVYFVDKDCDGYGAGKRVDGIYPLGIFGATGDAYTRGTAALGDLPDADDGDPTVNTTATWQAKWGATNAGMVNFIAARKSNGHTYNTARIWYVSLTGSDTTGAMNDPTHPYLSIGAAMTALHDTLGGIIVIRGGNYGTSANTDFTPCHYPGGNCYNLNGSSGHETLVMAYPGELVILSSFAYEQTTYWPGTNMRYWTIDGISFLSTQYNIGIAIKMADADHITIRNCNFAGWDQGIYVDDHMEYFTAEDCVFSDVVEHSVYIGHSSAMATYIHGLPVADLDFTAIEASYQLGGNPGASHDIILRGLVSYNVGISGYEPYHLNAYMTGGLVERCSAVYSGGTGIGLQSGVYNTAVRNNFLADNGRSAGVTLALYGGEGSDPAAATLRWNTIEHNTIIAGSTSDAIRNTSPEGCIALADTSSFTGHWIKDTTIRNNLCISYGDSTSAAFIFGRNSFPNTHTLSHNLIYGHAASPQYAMTISADAYNDGHDAGNYTPAQFAGYGANVVGNLVTEPHLADFATSYTLTPERINPELQLGSPAINAGIASGVGADAKNRPRDASVDIGAYEYGAVVSVAVMPGSLSGGMQTVPYSVTLSASGGTAPYSWLIASGTLPPGLSFNPATGALTGTPTTAGTYLFSLQATEFDGMTGASSYSLAVRGAAGKSVTRRGVTVRR